MNRLSRAARLHLTGTALCFLLPACPYAQAQFEVLQEPPQWGRLEPWQHSLTRADFEKRLPVFSPDGTLRDYLDISDEAATVYRTPEKKEVLWKLAFAPADTPAAIPASERSLAPLNGAGADRPLAGKTIALDPGHIGGEWANMEERYLKVGRYPPVQEGDMTLIVCRHLETLLRAAGAEVVWTRNTLEPVTELRPHDLAGETLRSLEEFPGEASLGRLSSSRLLRNFELRSERLFYRTAEIIKRAAILSGKHPDLTLCVHYNAAPTSSWRKLYHVNKLVLFVHGSYTAVEIADEQQRFQLFGKLLENSTPLEVALASSIADSMRDGWGYPPENYADSENAHRIGGNPYVWSRNLLANRLYPGPVVFVEGPYMNDTSTFKRMVEGDYEGEKAFDGRQVRSIHREYAEYIARGIIDYYRRAQTPPPDPVSPGL